ncbi:MAG: XdhC family protein [SAR324 cluster bacterium]|nr:XdhC family protein [SAR324 cluster bacterium]
MRDIWTEQLSWLDSGQPFVLARVIKTWRSAPRKSGAGMLIGSGMKVAGSVSGGCIEGAVIEEALDVLESGESRTLSYGVEDELALSVGLSCGGEVTVLLEKHWAFSIDLNTRIIWDTLQNCIRNNKPAILISPLPTESGSSAENQSPLLVLPEGENVGLQQNREEVIALAEGTYNERENKIVEIGGNEFFIQVFPRRDQLLIIGAGHITIPLVRFAKELDFLTVVIDPRTVFANPERFPVPPDQLISKWPDDVLPDFPLNDDTYAVLLTHDPKIDDPALHILLKNNLPYIGALGSSRTHAKRCARLEEAGFNADTIAQIKGPAGADIGAQTAAEIALSMIAEVVAAKHGKL